MNDELFWTMRECAHLLPKTEERRMETFGRWDGIDIPPSTRIRVTVELVHIPDPEVMPELETELEYNPT